MNQPTRLFDFPYFQQEHFPLEVMMTSRKAGVWTNFSTDSFIEHMNLVSQGLLSMGINPGDRIALITDTNRSEWNIMDHGILQIGAIDVPIYPTMTSTDYEYIMNHAEARLCFVSNKDLYDKVMRAKPQIASLENVYTFEKVEGAPHWSEILDKGRHANNSGEVKRIADSISPLDMATIIYTSGTTGLPKGVMLSHQNIASNAVDCEERLPAVPKGKGRSLSFLPCCHIYERMLHYLYMANGVTIYLTGLEAVKDDLIYSKPHIFTAVPRLLEKFYDGIYASGMSNTGIKKKLFKWAHDLALEWTPEGENGWWYEFQLGIARKLVFSKVKAALGLTELGGLASGSAALQLRLARFFNGAGITTLEGYGLTETSPVISVNTIRSPHMYRNGTVGKPIKDVEVKIQPDGEIICKGPNVMMGYYKDPEKTAEVLKDGWFYTGDIGEFRDGFLAITDRKKELFKTSGGKYVAPQIVENAMKESTFIEQIMVIGDGQKYPAALIVPEMVGLKKWAASQGIPTDNIEELVHNQKVNTMIDQEIAKINPRFGKWEQVKAFRLLPRQFSIEQGEITPTLKLKRKKVMENWAYLVTEIYSSKHMTE